MSKGFTLIELIVAISLLTMGVAGSFTLMREVTSFASISSSRFVASYLAQEGIEIIRNIRDTNYLYHRAWDDNIGVGSDFRLDYRSDAFPDTVRCVYGAYLQYTGNFYICSADSNSKFQRKIIVEKPASDKIVVSVEVSWSEHGVTYQVFAETELRNWR